METQFFTAPSKKAPRLIGGKFSDATRGGHGGPPLQHFVGLVIFFFLLIFGIGARV